MGDRCYASIRGARPDGAGPSHRICRDVTVPGSAGTPARVLCPAVDATALRSQFPVFEERAYLNSGTCGPLPRRALHAVADVLARAAVEGRTRHVHGDDDLDCATASGPRTPSGWARPRRRRAHEQHERGRRPRPRRPVARAGRRGPDRARRASRPARPARVAARAPRRRHPDRAVRGPRRRGRATHAARRVLARQLGHRRRAARRPRRAAVERAGPARRRPGRRRGADRRRGARLRVLRGVGPEVALRAGRDRDAVDRSGPA